MNNLLYLNLIEAERRRDRLAEASQYRLIKQAKQQKITVGILRLRSSLSQLLESWASWLMKRSVMLAITSRNDQTSKLTTINVGEIE
jgi:hypothetical protein